MSHKLFALIVVACLVVEASCVLEIFKLKRKSKQVDDDNLERLEADTADLPDGRLMSEAELVAEVSKMAKQCNEEDLPALIQLANMDSNVEDDKRVEKVLKGADLQLALKKCADKVADINTDMIMGHGLHKFMEFIRPLTTFSWDNLIIHDKGHDWVLTKLHKLAKQLQDARFKWKVDDQANGQRTNLKDVDKFKEAFEKHLVKPCEKMLSDPRLELIIDAMAAVGKLGADERHYMEFGYNAQKLAWRRDTCMKYTKMDTATQEQIFNEWSPPAHHV